MNRNTRSIWTRLTASFCAVLMVPSGSVLIASPPALARTSTGAAAARQTTTIPADQLDSLVAPIALYPDPLLAQMLAASTYPLEIVQLQQWLEKNPTLKDDALAAAVEKQDWDPSVQAMAGVPEAVKRLSDDIKWTTELGNAFLAQQSDVMDAVQRMRGKAEGTGNLKSTSQQVVKRGSWKTKRSSSSNRLIRRLYTCRHTTRRSSTVLRCIPTHPSTIRLRAITRQAWRSRSVSASRWVRCLAAAGDGERTGEITTSISTGTTTSTAT